MEKETISVIVEAQPKEDKKRVLGGKSKDKSLAKALDTEVLSASMQAFSKKLSHIFEHVEVGKFQLDEVSLQVEITSEGEISLIGSLRAGVKGALTLTFKPQAIDTQC